MATTASSHTATPGGVVVGVVSEAIVPGGSHLIKGDFATGAAHLVLGIAAGLALGPLGVLGVKALSLAKSTTGESPLDRVTR
jgi:hypothetical protein